MNYNKILYKKNIIFKNLFLLFSTKTIGKRPFLGFDELLLSLTYPYAQPFLSNFHFVTMILSPG